MHNYQKSPTDVWRARNKSTNGSRLELGRFGTPTGPPQKLERLRRVVTLSLFWTGTPIDLFVTTRASSFSLFAIVSLQAKEDPCVSNTSQSQNQESRNAKPDSKKSLLENVPFRQLVCVCVSSLFVFPCTHTQFSTSAV